jgi:hypothetical protein
LRLGRARRASSWRPVHSGARWATADDPCFGCLLELVRRFTRVVIIGAPKSPAEAGCEPGEVVNRPGCEMPAEVIVYAIKAADVETLGDELVAS